MNVCHPCYQLSSLLPLAGNRDDSNRDDIEYEKLSFTLLSRSKNLKFLYHNIYANNAFSVFGLILFAAYYFFSKKIGNRVYRMSSLLPVMFAQNIKLHNTLLLHSFIGLKSGACRYILQKMKKHFLQNSKEYSILCV